MSEFGSVKPKNERRFISAMKVQKLRERLRESTGWSILVAAEAVAAEERLPAASLQAVAQRAGVSVGTIYNYFDDRQQLFDELFARRRMELFSSIEADAKRTLRAPFLEQLESFVRTVFTHFDARRDFLRLALDGEQPRQVVVKGSDGKRRPTMQQLIDHAERIFRVGVREKRLREDAPAFHAIAFTSLLRGVLVTRVDDEGPLVAETERVLDLFLHGAAR
jgi:AcrR family transcriptional regulator